MATETLRFWHLGFELLLFGIQVLGQHEASRPWIPRNHFNDQVRRHVNVFNQINKRYSISAKEPRSVTESSTFEPFYLQKSIQIRLESYFFRSFQRRSDANTWNPWKRGLVGSTIRHRKPIDASSFAAHLKALQFKFWSKSTRANDTTSGFLNYLRRESSMINWYVSHGKTGCSIVHNCHDAFKDTGAAGYHHTWPIFDRHPAAVARCGWNIACLKSLLWFKEFFQKSLIQNIQGQCVALIFCH